MQSSSIQAHQASPYIFQYNWNGSDKKISFKLNSIGKIIELDYENINDPKDEIFIKALRALMIGHGPEHLIKITAREIDYFLREDPARTGLLTLSQIEFYFKSFKDLRLEIERDLLKKLEEYGYTYEENKKGLFKELSLENKKTELAHALFYYSKIYYRDVLLELDLVDVDELVVVVDIKNFPDKEHVLENLRKYLCDELNERQINVIPEI